jgi:hypothetical protein
MSASTNEWAKAEVTDVKHGQTPHEKQDLCIAIYNTITDGSNCLRIHIQMFNLVAITDFRRTNILTIRSICWLSLTRILER